jgi:type I restriction enzyme S subunit
MNRYRGVAGDIHLQREVLLRQVQNLRLTRDLLLPRLLSGQIDVESLPEPVLSES